MPKLLVFLAMPELVRGQYGARIAARFPELEIDSVGSRAEACRAISDADMLLTFGAMMGDEVLKAAGSLKWVHALGTGVDGIIGSPSLGADVMVTSTRGIHGAPMSEMALMLMLALSRDFPRIVHGQDDRAWQRWPATLLHNKTAGILGVGLIAEALAPRCKALGMTVIGISETPREVPGIDRIFARSDLDEAVAGIDYLIVLVPYMPATDGLVNEATFRAMKPSAYLINIARGGVVDEDALVAALQAGEIAGAALDTFVEEPLPPGHPLWRTPNTIITPHIGGFCDVYPDLALPQFETNLRCFLAGETASMINRESR
jgi:phosphoglycerate dehydrogenase-like enzyme